jgi:hypothetical protein
VGVTFIPRELQHGNASQAAKQPSSQAAKQPSSQAAKQPSSQAAKQPSSYVARIIGSSLLVAAGLKLYGMSVSAIPPVGVLSSPMIQSAAVLWELVLGLWLISSLVRPLSWLAALATFTLFAVISGYLGSIGQAKCGCFGTIEASPWAAFAVDIAAIAALLFTMPKRDSWRAVDVSPLFLKALPLLGGAAAILALSALGSTLTYGSISAGLAKLRGESIGAPSYVDFGSAKPGEKLEQQVEVRNWTKVPIRLIGGTSDCSFITTSKMPLTIPPGEVISVAINLKVPSSDAGAFTRSAAIWTDCDQQRTLAFRLGCRVE